MNAGTPIYISPKEQTYLYHTTLVDRDMIEKRDVYALGIVFIFLLLGKYTHNHEITYLSNIHNLPLSDIDKLKKNTFYQNMATIYNGEQNDHRRLRAFLKLIKDMTMINYQQRITMEKALQELSAIR